MMEHAASVLQDPHVLVEITLIEDAKNKECNTACFTWSAPLHPHALTYACLKRLTILGDQQYA